MVHSTQLALDFLTRKDLHMHRARLHTRPNATSLPLESEMEESTQPRRSARVFFFMSDDVICGNVPVALKVIYGTRDQSS